MEVSDKKEVTIGRFVAIPSFLLIDVKTLDDILRHSSRGSIPFYIIMRQNNFNEQIKKDCKIYEVLEDGRLTLQTDNFH